MAKHHLEILSQEHFEQQYKFAPPHESLAEVVEFYWQLDLRDVSENFVEDIFATLQASLVFVLGTPFKLLSEALQVPVKRSVLIGHHTQKFTYQHDFGNYLVGIKLKPAGLNLLLGIPAAVFNNQLVLVDDVLFRNMFLEEQLALQKTWPQQVDLLNSFMLGTLFKAKEAAYRTRYVAAALYQAAQNGAVFNVEHLASNLHLTRRSLERYFKQELGIGPKWCLNLIRFRQALKTYKTYGYQTDFEQFGYIDYAHFNKDYRKFLR